MPFDRIGPAALLAAALVTFAPGLARVASAQEAEDAGQSSTQVCDGKARLRGPVFASGSAQVEPGTLVTLDLIAEKIKRDCAGKPIVIEGHTDTWGDPAYNQRLSEVRAREIKRLLVARGVPADQLEPVGYGATRPISTGKTAAEQALNRRITLQRKDTIRPRP